MSQYTAREVKLLVYDYIAAWSWNLIHACMVLRKEKNSRIPLRMTTWIWTLKSCRAAPYSVGMSFNFNVLCSVLALYCLGFNRRSRTSRIYTQVHTQTRHTCKQLHTQMCIYKYSLYESDGGEREGERLRLITHIIVHYVIVGAG